MFTTLRPGAVIYIVDKGENPQLKIGQVENVTTPQPRLAVTGYAGGLYNNDMIMDIKVNANGETLDFQKVPANLSSATIGNVVVCDNREDAVVAVDNFMRNSQQILDNIDYHKKVVSACDEMLVQLNPAYAKDKERDTAIDGMKQEMAEIRGEFRGAISEIKNLLSLYAPSSNVGGHIQK